MFRSLRKKLAARRKANRSGRKSFLNLEALEARDVPALVLGPDGTLLYDGMPGIVHDDVSVSESADGRTTVRYKYFQIPFISGYRSESFPSAAVTRIRFEGGEGNDKFTNNTALRSTAYGRSGNDTLVGGDARDELVGGGEADSLVGGGGKDKLYGEGGVDTLDGAGGGDSLWGGSESDRLFGGANADTLDGGEGADELYGGAGNDTLAGHNGPDTLSGGSGNDSLMGEGDGDRLYGDDGFFSLYFDGQDTLQGGGGSDTLYGESGNDLLIGDGGNDQLYGDFGSFSQFSGHDTLRGGNGSDSLYGDEGNDRLYGGFDVDSLSGGYGNDVLFGGIKDNAAQGWVDAADSLHGGNGLDRFLADISDSVSDRETHDALIRFGHTTRSTSHLTSGIKGSLTFGPAQWTDAEVESVDTALDWLMRLTGNNRLLRLSDYWDLSFAREGAYVPRNATDGLNDADDLKANNFGATVGAWNRGHGLISITQWGFQSPPLIETVIHEVGHNSDFKSKSTSWKTLCGWQKDKTVLPGRTLSGDGEWTHSSSAGTLFYRSYSQWNPKEDWATTWEAYYQNKVGLLSAADATRLAAKLTLIDEYVNSLR